MSGDRLVLGDHEARVLGCLVEKESTTPDAYPLTVNSLRNACNQSTSRDPVMELSDIEVEAALGSLRERGLTRTVHSTSNRATKFRHVLPEFLDLDHPETSLVAVLLLRGGQTVGELKSRTERLHRFESTQEVADTLGGLRDRELVVRLERAPGQKDARWVDNISEAGPADGGSTTDGPVGTTSADPYGEATAEFYDLLATGHWETFGLQLLDLLGDVDPANGPIVDIGAGTGIGLPYLTAAVPGTSVYAVEPSRGMRIALHARLTGDDALRQRTTVDPRPLAEAGLPDRASAVIASAVLGHFSDAERSKLWSYVASALPTGAPAVVEVLPPGRPLEVPPTVYRELPVGEFTYVGEQRGTPLDDRTMSWTMTYRVMKGPDTVAVSEATSAWRCFTVDDVRAETAPFGLSLTEHDDAVVLRR